MIRERERPAFATDNAVDETRVWGAHQLARSSGRACGEGRPWLTSDESEPQQVCLNVGFVGLNGFLILCRRIDAGVSQQQVIMPKRLLEDDDAPASNLADVGPILGIRVADDGRCDKSHLLRAVRRISG
jgi:hypothetical protein